jgi:post-segregation antitoxin (ccd killing protein)
MVSPPLISIDDTRTPARQAEGCEPFRPHDRANLPDELDALSRRLGLNLSRLAQVAIVATAKEHPDGAFEARVAAAMARIAAIDIDWPADPLAASRAEAAER